MNSDNKTKFFHYSQNNSGGYHVNDAENGICEDVIIEAKTAEESWQILSRIGSSVSGFWSFCSCCGERWYKCEDREGTWIPEIYGESLSAQVQSFFRNRCFVHYLNGEIKEFVHKKP